MYWLNFVNLCYMKTVIKNISKLVQNDDNIIKFRAGNDMNHLNTISNAFIEIEDGLINTLMIGIKLKSLMLKKAFYFLLIVTVILI